MLLLRFLFRMRMLITWYGIFSHTTKLFLLRHYTWLTWLFPLDRKVLKTFFDTLAHELVHHFGRLRNRLSRNVFAPELMM